MKLFVLVRLGLYLIQQILKYLLLTQLFFLLDLLLLLFFDGLIFCFFAINHIDITCIIIFIPLFTFPTRLLLFTSHIIHIFQMINSQNCLTMNCLSPCKVYWYLLGRSWCRRCWSRS